MKITEPDFASPYIFCVSSQKRHEHYAVYVSVDKEEPYMTYAYVYRIHYFGDVKVFQRVYTQRFNFGTYPKKKRFAREVLAEFVKHLDDLPF